MKGICLFVPLCPRDLRSTRAKSMLNKGRGQGLFSILFLVLVLFRVLFRMCTKERSMRVLRDNQRVIKVNRSNRIHRFNCNMPFLQRRFYHLFRSSIPSGVPYNLINRFFRFAIRIRTTSTCLNNGRLRNRIQITRIFISSPRSSFRRFIVKKLCFC